MADNSNVLGQEPIEPQQINKPSQSNGANNYASEPPKFSTFSENTQQGNQSSQTGSKPSFSNSVSQIQSQQVGSDEAGNLALPENISLRQYQKRLGPTFNPRGSDISEAMAQAQSGWEQMGMLIPRAAAKAAQQALEMPGYIVGLGEWAATGFDPKEWGNAINNGWNVALDNLNNSLQEKGLPVYQSESVRDGNIFDKLASSSFWATEGADGVGFLVGMMAPGVLLRWANLGEKIAGVGKVFTEAEKLAMPAYDLDKVVKSAQTAARINDWSAAAVNTWYEAATEGQGTFNDYLQKNPNDVEGAGKAAAHDFLVNNAILIGPNMLNQKWLFNGFKRSLGAVESAGESTIGKALGKTLTETGAIAEIPKTTLFKKTVNAISKPALGILSEGFWEEGIQQAASEGAKKGRNIYNPIELIDEYVDQITAPTKGNTEMWSSIILGGLMGGGMEMIGHAKEAKQEKALVSGYHELLKNNYLHYLTTLKDFAKQDDQGKPVFKTDGSGEYDLDISKVINGGAQVIKNAELREKAIGLFQLGDKEGYDYISNLIHFDYMLPWLRIEGGKELLKRHINSISDIESQKDAEQLGIQTSNVEDIKKSLLDKAEKFQKIHDQINDTHDINLKVKLTEGAEKSDLMDFSNLVKSTKLSSKVQINYATERIAGIKGELAKLGITSKSDKITKDLATELENSYNEAKKVKNFDKSDDATIKKQLKNISRLSDLYDSADNVLRETYDNKKMQDAFDQKIKQKIAAEKITKEDSSNKTKEQIAKEITDPDLKKLWLDNTKTEDLSTPEKARVFTHRGRIRINYTDKTGKKQSVIVVVGDATATGGMKVRQVTTNAKGEEVLSNHVSFLNDIHSFKDTISSNPVTIDSITQYKTADESQRNDQLGAVISVYEKTINDYREDIEQYSNGIQNNLTRIDDLRTKLKGFLQEHKNSLLTEKGSERRIYIGTRNEAGTIIRVYKTVSELKDEIQSLKKNNSTLRERIVLRRQTKTDWQNKLKAFKQSEEFPLQKLQDLADYSEKEQASAENLLDLSTQAISEAETLIKSTTAFLKGYNTQLAKALGISISDKALGIEDLGEREKLDIISNILINKVNEIRSDTDVDSYIFPETEYNLAKQLQATKEKLENVEAILAENKEREANYTKLRDQFRKEKLAAQSQFNKIYRVYKNSTAKYFKESDVYEENLIDGKKSTSIEQDFPSAFSIANNFEPEERHPYTGFDSFLTLTSSQLDKENGALVNPDVARWFVFVNNHAYKGLESSNKPKYSFKTFTFDQVAKSNNRLLKDKLRFWVGDKFMSYNEIIKTKDNSGLIENANNDIKSVVVDYGNTNNFVTVSKEGDPFEIDERKNFLLFTSLGLETEVRESGKERFSFRQAQEKYIAEHIKEGEERTTELEEEAAKFVADDFKAQQQEFLAFRNKATKESQILNITSINPGFKESENAKPVDLLEAITEPLQSLTFRTSSPIKTVNETTGEEEFADSTIPVSGREYKAKRGFTYVLYKNRPELVKPKTLQETGDANNIFNIFRYISNYKDGYEELLDYLKQALYMQSDNPDFRLFLTKLQDKGGKVVEGKYNAIIFGQNEISIEDLAANRNTTEFKEFLANKYWNFDKDLLNDNASFTEFKVNSKLDKSTVVWDGHKGGYKAFLFSPVNKNQSKGTINITPLVRSKEDKHIQLAKNPQYSNQSLNTTVRGTTVKTETKSKVTGVGQVLKVTLTDESGKKKVRSVVYYPEDQKMFVEHDELEGKDKLNTEPGKIIAKNIKEALNNNDYTLDDFKDVEFEGIPFKISVALDHEIEGTEDIGATIAGEDTGLTEVKTVKSTVTESVPVEGNFTDNQIWDGMSDERRQEYLGLNEGNLEDAKAAAVAKFNSLSTQKTYNRAVREHDSRYEFEKKSTRDWLTKKFPKFPVEVVNGIIEGRLWGQLRNGSVVLISNLAEEGTSYHEGFHVWNNLFNTEENRDSLYNEVRKRLANKEMSNLEAEEFLAEEFRDYMMQGKAYKFNKGQEVQKSVFQKILDAIKHFFSMLGINIETASNNEIENAFNTLDEGTFIDQIDNTKQSFNRVADIEPVKTLAFVKDMNARFFDMLIQDIDKGGDFVFKFEQNARELYNTLKGEYEMLTLKDKLSKQPQTYKQLLDNWGEFVKEHTLFLTQYAVDIREDVGEDDLVSRNNGDYRESSLSSIKEKISRPVKLLIGSLPSVRMVDNDIIATTDSKYFTRSTVEFNKIMNILTNNLANITEPQGILDKILELSEDRPELKLLYKRLGGGQDASAMSLTQMRLFGQFYNSFSANKAKPILMTIKNDGTITYKNLVNETDKEVLQNSWITNAQNLANADNSRYISSKNGDFIVDKKALSKDLETFISKKNAGVILKNLGIDISGSATRNNAVTDYLNRLREQLKVFPEDRVLTLNDIYNRDVIQNQKEMNSLMELATNYVLNDTDLMYFNQNGDMEWSITRNSHISEVTNRLNDYGNSLKVSDGTEIPDNLKHLKPFDGSEGNLYNLHSLYWNLISSGKYTLELSTLKGLTSQNGDGREMDHTNYADYKMATFDSILHNIIPLKRAADRGPEYAFHIQDSNFKINEDVFTNTMLGYLYDEVITSFAVQLKSKQFGYGLKNYSENAKNLRTFDFLFNEKYNEGRYIQPLEDFLANKDTKGITFDKLKDYTQEWIDSNPAIIDVMKNFISSTNMATRESLIESNLIIRKRDMWEVPGLNRELIEDKFGGFDGNRRISNANLDRILMLHSYNFFVGMQEQFKMFLGDPAGYKSVQDLDKRTTSSASTRTKIANDDKTLEQLDLIYPNVNGTKHSKIINKVIVSPIKANASEDLIKFNKKYKGMDIADGQMWGTLDFIRGLHARNGNWSDAHEATYQYEIQNLVLRVLKDKSLQKIWTGASEDMFTTGVFSKHTNGKVPTDPMFKGEVIKIGTTEMAQVPAIKPLGAGYNSSEDLNVGIMDINKMSVAPMFPSLLDDNKLKFVLSMMEHNIDKFGDPTTEKSDYYPNEGNIDDGYLVDKKTKISQISYDDYGTQSDIQEEEKGKVTDSTQKISVIYNNIFDKGELLPAFKDLESNVKERDGLLNDLNRRNREDIISELSLSKDEESGLYHLPEASKEKFQKLLTNMFIQRLLPNNIIDGLGLMLNSKEQVLDLFSDSQKVEQILTAFIRNNVIKRKVSGEMYVQESSYLYGQGLKFYEKGKDGTSRAECMIPIPTSWIPWVEKMGGVDELNKQLSDGKLPKEMTEFLANRIPTADINTIEAFSVKKFLPNYVGARIILPSEIVTKTSSDYDIDKLTCYFNNFIVDETGKNAPKYITGNSKEGIENRLNTLHSEALLHKERYDQLLEPHANDNLKALATKLYTPSTFLEKLEKEDTGKYATATQWWYNVKKAQDFWQGIQGVAYAASNNTVNSQMQQFPIEMQDTNLPIFFDGQKLGENEKYTSGHVTDNDEYNTASNYGEFLVSFVDVAKDPFILSLNASTKTFGIYSFLNKFGIKNGVGLEQIATFMTHPIIKSYVNQYMDIYKSIFSKHNQYVGNKVFDDEKQKLVSDRWFENNIGYQTNIINDLLEKENKGDPKLPKNYEQTVASSVDDYLNETSLVKKEKLRIEILNKIKKYKYTYLSIDDLKSNRNKNKLATQVLDNFLMYQMYANQGLSLNSVLRPYAVASFDKSLNGIQLKVDKLKDIKNEGFFSAESIDKHLNNSFLNESNKTYQTTLDALSWTTLTRKYPDLGDLFKYHFVSKLKYVKKEDATKVLNSAKSQFLSYVFAYRNKGGILGTQNRYKELFTGDNSLPNRLREMSKEGKITNELFKLLRPVVNQYSAEVGRVLENHYITTHNKKLGVSEENMYTAIFEELFSSKDQKVLDFAKDLLEFSMYQNGVEYSPIGYMKIVPNTVFMDAMDRIIGHVAKAGMFDDKSEILFQSYVDQFYRNNYKNKDLVFNDKDAVSTVATEDGGEDVSLSDIAKPIEFGLKTKAARYEYITRRYNKTTAKERKSNKKQKLRSATEWLLYKRVGEVEKPNGKTMIQYQLVNKLGDGYRFREYYPTDKGVGVKSILKANNYEGVVEVKKPVEPIVVNKKGKVIEKKDTSKTYVDDIKRIFLQREESEDKPNEKVDNAMMDFLDTIGVKVKTVDMLRDKFGTKVPGIAVAKLSEMTVEIMEGKQNLTQLPEEAAHFYVSMLDENNGLYKSMYNNIINYPVYQKVLDTYSEQYGNDEKKLREEAMGKLIADRIVRGVDPTLPTRQQEQTNNWWSKLWNYIKEIFTKTKNDPYTKSAYDILTKNVSELILPKVNLGESVITKQQAIEEVLTKYNESDKQLMREDLTSMDKNELDEMLKKAGYNSLGKYYTLSSVNSFYQLQSLEDQWNKLPFTAKGIYKFDYQRTIDAGEKAYNGYVNAFGEDNVTLIPLSDSINKIKIAIKKPLLAHNVEEKIVNQEDIAIANMQELAKAPIKFSAEDLIKNFDDYFPEDSYLEDSEKIALMQSIENGYNEIACSF